ncbi:MAG: galactokinase family protein, partial [Oscillospiraceae bacterium]|nr:galactokinase family protein [Oscillospiraceae bacterium]
MATVAQMLRRLEQGELDACFRELYGIEKGTVGRQRARYGSALEAFGRLFGPQREIALYSTPGRTEIGGNHTDHNGGLSLAAAVTLDVVAVVSKNNDNVIRIRSRGYAETICIDLNVLEKQEKETGRSPSLIRGVAAAVQHAQGRLGGFDAYTTSEILKGSGLSSSAAFEVLVATILNEEYNNAVYTPFETARMGQYAENEYYGKACGRLDQLACACGGALAVDFKDPECPRVEQFELDAAKYGFTLCITDTKSSHGDVLSEYSGIRLEMEAVAAEMGCVRLSQIEEKEFVDQLPRIREKLGDRCILRALHFFEECRRAEKMCTALAQKDWNGFLKQVLASGHSSFEYNQNAYLPGGKQGIPLGLAISQLLLEGKGAWRLHGGGFAGTVQAYVPDTYLTEYV